MLTVANHTLPMTTGLGHNPSQVANIVDCVDLGFHVYLGCILLGMPSRHFWQMNVMMCTYPRCCPIQFVLFENSRLVNNVGWPIIHWVSVNPVPLLYASPTVPWFQPPSKDDRVTYCENYKDWIGCCTRELDRSAQDRVEFVRNLTLIGLVA